MAGVLVTSERLLSPWAGVRPQLSHAIAHVKHSGPRSGKPEAEEASRFGRSPHGPGQGRGERVASGALWGPPIFRLCPRSTEHTLCVMTQGFQGEPRRCSPLCLKPRPGFLLRRCSRPRFCPPCEKRPIRAKALGRDCFS